MGSIVWLASYPKSGSTWLRAFVANLIANNPDPVWPDHIRRYSDFEAGADLFCEAAGRPSTSLTANEIASLRLRAQKTIAQRANGARIVMTHNFCGSFNGHPLVNWQVTAGAVYVVRNPLDVVVSMTRHFDLTLDDAIVLLGDERVASANDELFVSNFIGSWSTHVKSWIGAAQHVSAPIIVLRYEDLLKTPVRCLGKVAKLIGLDEDADRVERAVEHASFQTLSAMELKHGFVEAVSGNKCFFFKGQADQWQKVLSRAQVARVIHDHHEHMERLQYLPEQY